MELSARFSKWNKHEILDWAVKIVGVQEETAQILSEAEMDGETLE